MEFNKLTNIVETLAEVIRSDKEREDHVRKVLDLPEKYRVICNIGIGYPDEESGEKRTKNFDEAADVVE